MACKLLRRVSLLCQLAAISAVCFSCINEKDEPQLEISDRIVYDITSNNGFKTPSTKSTAQNVKDNTSGGRKVSIEKLEQNVVDKNLYLHTIVENWEEDIFTKGTEIKDGDLTSIGVSAWVYPTSNYSNGTGYFTNDIVENPWSSNRYWPMSQENIRFYAYAPLEVQNGEKVDGVPSYLKLPELDHWTNGIPSFDFQVPQNVTEQSDLLVASSNVANANFGETAHLEFGHALTAVQFKIDGVDGLDIKTIQISGVYNSGTYTYDYYGSNGDGNPTDTKEDYDKGAWVLTSNHNAAYTLDFTNGELDAADGLTGADYAGKFVCNGQSDKILNEGNYVFFLMPQTLPADAKIILEGYDRTNGKDIQLTADIGGKLWEKGKKVIYKLSISSFDVEYVFEIEDVTVVPQYLVDDTVNDTLTNIREFVPFYGELDRALEVKSYKIITEMGGTTRVEPLKWYIDEDKDNKDDNVDPIPYWLDRFEPRAGVGGNTIGAVETITYDAIAQTPTYGASPSKSHVNLREFTHENKTPDKAYDLSTKGGSEVRNTANCYIVDSPGYYKIPLVYGNAITGGIDVISSYTYSGNSSYVLYSEASLQPDETAITANYNILTKFYNYAGEPTTENNYTIQNAWITKDGWIAKDNLKAEIVWQDEPCVITEAKIEINGDEGYLHFRVREDCICESNSVVAVKLKDDNNIYGKGTIFWSWHIWITDKNQTGFANDVSLTSKVDYYNDDNESFSEYKFELMPIPLGFCDAEEKIYEPRSAKLTFRQIENDAVRATKIYSINQVGDNSVIVTQPDNVVYYQYGRKDPIIPGYFINKVTSTDKPYYTERRVRYSKGYGGGRVGFHQLSKDEVLKINDGITKPGEMFQAPQIFLTSEESTTLIRARHWYGDAQMCAAKVGETNNSSTSSNFYINLWNNNNSILPMFTYKGDAMSEDVYGPLGNMGLQYTAKTIYDPSPAGYEVPSIDAFAGLTYGGLNYVNDPDKGKAINFNEEPYAPAFYDMPNHLTPGGIRFKNDKGNGSYFIGAFGYRSDDLGKIEQYGNYGGALTSNPICIQWPNDNEASDLQQFFLIGSSRMYFELSKAYSPISSSSFAHAFPVIPAKTGSNPAK